MFTPYNIKSDAEFVAMVRRWFSISKSKRAQAIAEQHGYSNPSEIFHRRPNGKCDSWESFVADYEIFTISFDYWGQISMDDACLFSQDEQLADLTPDYVLSQIRRTAGELYEQYEEPAWHDECDRDWEYIPEDD